MSRSAWTGVYVAGMEAHFAGGFCIDFECLQYLPCLEDDFAGAFASADELLLCPTVECAS